jgi:hypothetical protein
MTEGNFQKGTQKNLASIRVLARQNADRKWYETLFHIHLILFKFKRIFSTGLQGMGDILNGSVPQSIPKMKWILTQMNTLLKANPMIPILIGSKNNSRHDV